jgi:hypothetical protein
MIDVANTHDRSRETANKTNPEPMRTPQATSGGGKENIELAQRAMVESPLYRSPKSRNESDTGRTRTEYNASSRLATARQMKGARTTLTIGSNAFVMRTSSNEKELSHRSGSEASLQLKTY